MRKLLSTILTGLILTGVFVGCGTEQRETTKNENKITQEKRNEEVKKEVEEKQANKSDLINEIDFSKITITGEVQPPDCIGVVYFQGAYTNNLEYTVTFISVTYEYYDESLGFNTKSYFTTRDTLLPGETSSVCQCFGGPNMNPLKMDVKIFDGEKEHSFTLDYKLGTVKQHY